MSFYALSMLIAVISTIIIGIFVYLNGRDRDVNRLFGLYCAVLSIWVFGCFMESSVATKSAALFWDKFLYTGALLCPSVYLHFLYVITRKKEKRIYLILSYLSAIFFLLFNYIPVLRPYFVLDVLRKYSFRFIATPGMIWYFFFSLYGLHLIYGFLILFSKYKEGAGQSRIQIKYLIFAYLIMIFAGLFYFLLLFNIPTPPIDPYMLIGYGLIMSYAIVRHQLMEIEVIIKKTLVFASLFAIVFGVFVGVTMLTQELLAGGRLLGLAVSSLIIILMVRPLENFLVRVTDKYLFQRKYDYKQVLKSFIDEVITVLNLDRIINSTLELLDKTLHPENTAILLLNRYEDRYVSYETLGYNKEITLENSSKLVMLLKATKDIFSVEHTEGAVRPTEELKIEMTKLNSRLAIPLMLHNDLIGIILLGKKKSDEEYTKDDLDILTDLARTEAIAIGNSQLFAEAAQNERRAAIGTLAAGINHEIGNPLNIIGTKMQIYLMSLKRGLYKDKPAEAIIKESEDTMNICMQQINRISDITKKLSNFARPSKEFRPELTDVERQIDETLAVVGHELELEHIEIKRDIQRPLPKILADERQIQQIFFNIIKNAGQAIKEKGIVEIRVYSAMDGKMNNVRVEISDTGHGIPEDKIDKIYDPFFTTKGVEKGTGLGLSIVRQLVWRNRGDIRVKSRVGEGTTFTVTFPVA